MKIKNKKQYQIIISITAWIFCAVSSSFGYSFVNDMPWSFRTRFLVGLVLMMAPVSLSWLIFELFRKENRKQYQITISITTWIFCAVSSSFGYSFVNDMPWSFQTRFLVGLVLIMAPVLVFWVILELFRKAK